MTVIVAIPARVASTRLPRKLLLEESGQPLFTHVFGQVAKCRLVDACVVVTGDEEICERCDKWQLPHFSTVEDHPNGTSRIAEFAEAADDLLHDDIIVNVQADEPEIDPNAIDLLISQHKIARPDMGTLVCSLDDVLKDLPNVVKAVVDYDGSVSDFHREYDPGAWQWHHIGIYSYSPEFLRRYRERGPCKTEVDRDLEQMRAIEIGAQIRAWPIRSHMPGIDTREQYDAFLARLG